MTKKEILERIKMQAPLKKKLALADFVIDNSGSRKETLLQIRKIWKQIGADYV
jgi:dephospho-CoA kinase